MSPSLDRLHLVGPTGSNKVMAGELSRLCRRAPGRIRLSEPEKLGPGGVGFPFDRQVAQVALRYHRTSSRVLWDLFGSPATRLEPLYDDLRAAVAGDERPWIWEGARFSIRPRNLGGIEAGVRQVVGAVKNAILDGCRDRGRMVEVAAEGEDLLVAIRRHDDQLLVSIDLAGGPMHERGYRTEAGEAPLRENLAAALLMLARYDARTDVLVDPMAGSGTIAIEAALMARGEPLRAELPRAASWPIFEGVSWGRDPLFGDTRPTIMAADLDARSLAILENNAERAGARPWIQTVRADVRELRAPILSGERTGLIVTNPPYGRRLAGDEELHRELGAFHRRSSGYRAAVLVEDARYEQRFGARPRVVKPLPNGGVRTVFYLFDAAAVAPGMHRNQKSR